MGVLNLFIAFFRVGLLSFGGGYVLIPLIEKEVVSNYHWLTQEEFLQILGISQGVPGAISVKFATYTGYRVAGIPGVILANLGVILPPAVIMLVLYGLLARYSQNPQLKLFLRGVTFGTIGLLMAMSIEMGGRISWNITGLILLLASLLLISLTKIHPGVVIVLTGLAGIIILR